MVCQDLSFAAEGPPFSGAVHVQARPVMRAVPVAVHPSEAPLTVPEAPELATIGRSQARQLFEEQLAIKEEKLQARDQNSACSC